MIIQYNLTIKEIQGSFQDMYPGLKIELYEMSHGVKEGSRKEDQYDPALHLYEIRSKHSEGDFRILPTMTIKEVENLF